MVYLWSVYVHRVAALRLPFLALPLASVPGAYFGLGSVGIGAAIVIFSEASATLIASIFPTYVIGKDQHDIGRSVCFTSRHWCADEHRANHKVRNQQFHCFHFVLAFGLA